MHKTHLSRSRLKQMLFAGVMIGLMLLISACGGNTPTQKQASQGKAQLDHLLQHAQIIGVPMSLLQPVVNQEQQLNSSREPFTLSNTQPATNYYQNLTTRYNQLAVQVQSIIATNSEQLQSRAQYDMQNFQLALSQVRSAKHFANIDIFSQQFDQDQALLSSAQYPKDYVVVSNKAHTSTEALNLVETIYQRLSTFKNTIAQMHVASLDVTAMQAQYQGDIQVYNSATTLLDFQNLSTLIDAQYQQAVVSSLVALPYVGAAKLNEFQTQLDLMKTYGLDASMYQNHLTADQAALGTVSNISDYIAVATKIDADIASLHDILVKGEAIYLVKKIDQEARAWGQDHLFHDNLNGKDYLLTAGYIQTGIGYWLNRELGWTYTTADYQSVINEENDQLFNLQMLEADYNDTTPFDQVHATDMQMMDHYNLHHGTVIMVSEVEQAERFYQDGKLVRAFHVTTGRQERPALPGVWTTQERKSPDTFKSVDPPGSPYWYPDTPIHYAILYHWGGFFIHDSWWRKDYGPGTQFPHNDSGGDQSFSGNGSHGCINMQEDQAAWVYDHTDWKTMISIY